jgi:hypothetical protein
VAIDVTTEPGPPLKVAPVVEYNKANVGSVDNPQRPRFDPLADGLVTEGLTTDGERGSSSTSARREAPSQVFGYLTPRGNTVHVDDNTGNEFIRMRTRSGTQVLIHETSGYVYINSKNGNSWIEVSDAGIDVYTANSISMRAEQDFNIRADRDILLDAGANVRMRAGSNITMMAAGDIQEQATGKINLNAAGNIELTSAGNILNIATNDFQVTSGNDTILSVGGTGSLNVASDLLVASGGNLRLQSAQQMTQLAGSQQMRDGTSILDNTGAAPAAAPDTPISITPPVLPPGLIHGDAKQKVVNNNPPFWLGGGAQVNTIVSRMPTHEPWHDHPNADVPPPPTDCVEINAAGTFDAGSSSNVNSSTVTTGSGATATMTGTLNDAGCSPGASGTKKISTDVYNAIMHACTKTGADPATMLAFADMESSFQPGVGARGSSATGLYQFTSGTWDAMVTKYGNQYNVGRSQINDAQSNALMGGQFLNDNVAILKRKGISNPTPGQCYIVHFAGSSGGPALIAAAQQTPDANAAAMFPAAAKSNPTIFAGKSCSQVVANLSAMADAKAKAYAGQYGLPAPCDRGAAGAPAAALDPTATAAAEMNAPAPIVMNTVPSGSVPAGVPTEGGTAEPPAESPNVPVGGTGSVCQAGSNPIAAGANGYVGSDSQSSSLVAAAGASNPSQWTKGSTDPTTWTKNQPIAIFNDDGTYNGAHAAIFLSLVQVGSPGYTGVAGILVYDQSPGQPARQRIIPYDKANANNASLYAAVNTPAGAAGSGRSGGMEPDLPPNPQGANKVRQACITAYPANTGNCSGFVTAVGNLLGVTISGNADAITTALKAGGKWSMLSGGAAAAAAAKAGQLVVGGLIGGQCSPPQHHGHVVVVVDGPVLNGLYPTAYWGSLGYIPKAYAPVNLTWTRVDLPKVTYAAMSLG